MRAMWYIILREVRTRVRKKSFWILTVLGPVLMLGMLIMPMYVSLQPKKKTPVVLEVPKVEAYHTPSPDERFTIQVVDSVITMPAGVVYIQSNPENRQFTVMDQVGLNKQELWYLEHYIQQWYWKTLVLKEKRPETVQPVFQVIPLAPASDGHSIQYMLGIYGAVLIYFFIIFYGVQVMRGVMEEKSGRIAEVLLSGVEPFQWMMGKIIGIGIVCIVQFVLWGGFYGWVGYQLQSRYGQAMQLFSSDSIENTLQWTPDVQQALEWHMIAEALDSFSIVTYVGSFVVFFLLGYLLYAAMFAALGAMTDQETETQQFTFPMTSPMFFVFLFSGSLLASTGGIVSVLSYLPFTAPVAMIMRLPMGVSVGEWTGAFLSLLFTFLGITYVAAKIFKRSILHYGGTMKWKDLW